MRVDTHVHTSFSGNTSIHPLKYLLRESYRSPEGVYRRAKARGMGLVANWRTHAIAAGHQPALPPLQLQARAAVAG